MTLASEPIVLSDFAWRQLPTNYPRPEYCALGETSTDAAGHCCIMIANQAMKTELLSGATWLTYARDGFSSSLLSADSVEELHASKAMVDSQRPLTTALAKEIFDKYCQTFDFDWQVDLCDCGIDPEIGMLVKGGVIAGFSHRMTQREQEDARSTMNMIAADLSSSRQITSQLSSPQSLIDLIKKIHRSLMRSQGESRGFVAGEWRNENVCLPNSTWCPPHQCELELLMQSYAAWACHAYQEMDPVLFSFELHCRFVYLHPFADGNGRLARILMNLVLLEAGYPPIVIAKKEKNAFCALLEQGFWGKKKEYYSKMLQYLNSSVDIYLAVLPSSRPKIPLQHQRNVWSVDSFDSVATSLHLPTIWEPSTSLNMSVNCCPLADGLPEPRRMSTENGLLDADTGRKPCFQGHPKFGASMGSVSNLSIPGTPGIDTFLDAFSCASPLEGSDLSYMNASPNTTRRGPGLFLPGEPWQSTEIC